MQSTYALLLLAQWGYGSSTLGFVLLASGFVIAIAQGLGGKIPSPHFERAAVLGSLLLGVNLYAFSLISTFWLHLVLFELHVLGFGLLAVTLPTMVSARTAPSQQGRMQGLGASVEAASRVVSPLVSGALWDASSADWCIGSSETMALLLDGSAGDSLGEGEAAGEECVGDTAYLVAGIVALLGGGGVLLALKPAPQRDGGDGEQDPAGNKADDEKAPTTTAP